MNARNDIHDPARLELFLNGNLDAADEREFVLHLSTCETCQQSLEQHAADAESWREAERLLKPTAFDATRNSGNVDDETPGARQPLQIQNVLDALTPTDDPRMIGRIGGYEVPGVIGAGGMGVVLKAIDKSLDRTVAIKVLAPHLAMSGAARNRFAREAKAAAAVLHPNVIAIHSVSNNESLPYIVMPYVRGRSLQKRLDQEGSLSVTEVLRIGSQIAAGLAAAHAQGLVHRDIKPANILLENGIERVTITDFGLARAVDDATITYSGVIAGTPQYMSPEQARGEAVDQQSDLFSLGSVLYAVCTGRPPFRAETSYGVLRRITDDMPTAIRELNPQIPEWLERIVTKLMAKRREDRFASAAELESLLRRCLAHVEQPLAVPLPDQLRLPAKSLGQFFTKKFFTGKRRIVMGVASLGALSVLGWLLMTQVSEPSKEGAEPSAAASAHSSPEKEEGKEKEKAVRASTTVDGYKIDVVDVADVSKMKMSMQFDMSRMKVGQPQFHTFGNSTNGGFAGGAVGGGAGGGGGTATGGFGGSFTKPNLGIALRIEPTTSDKANFVKVGSKVTVEDDLGEIIESGDLGPTVNHFDQFEKRNPNAQYIYLHQASSKASKFKRLEGELLVTPGRKLSVRFDGTRKQKRVVDKEAFALESVNIGSDGIQVAVKFPESKSEGNARSPQERFQAMIANRGSRSAIIEDSEGELHPASGASNAGGGVQQSYSLNGGSGQGSTKSDNSTQTFTFGTLPSGRTIKSIQVTFEDRTGEAKTVPFVLENVELAL